MAGFREFDGMLYNRRAAGRVVLSRLRDAMSGAITSRAGRFRRRLDDGSRAEDEGDPVAIYYSLWVSLTQLLAMSGWTSEELCTDVVHHANDQTFEDSA